jgi:hypothetical protein
MAVPISNVLRRIVFAASGTGPYAFTFEILAETDIAVYKDDTLLTLTTDYLVTINANGTGSVTLIATPVGATQIAIVGSRAIQRTTDFVTGGDFFANTVNDEMDSLTIFAQQNAEAVGRALQAPQTDPTTIDMTLPRAADRANKYLAFDANGDPQAGETAVEVAAIYAIRAEIEAVAAIDTEIVAVEANEANINTVAGISSNVTTVAGVAANVTTVAGIAANVTTVAGDATDIGTVSASIANVSTVAGISAAVSTVAGIDSDVTAVAADATDIGTVSTNIANVNTVAGISANVTTVAGISANVTSVAGNAANINAVAADATDIGTVATNIANVNTVAGDIAAIITAANDLNEAVSEIDTVATNIASVQTVGDNIASVNAVSSDISNVNAVAGDLVNIDAVAAELANLATKVSKTSDTGSAVVPAGTQAQRDGSPSAGYFRFNSDTSSFEGYNGSAWGSVGGGATGGGNDAVFVENDQVVTANYTIPSGKNAMSTGPVTINSGVTVTISSGSRYVVI